MSLSARNWAWDIDARARLQGDEPGEETMLPLKPGEKLTLLCIAEHESAELGYSYPSQELIAQRTQQTTRTVRRHVQVLEHAGLFEIQRRRSQQGAWLRNVYVLNVTDEFREADPKWLRHQR